MIKYLNRGKSYLVLLVISACSSNDMKQNIEPTFVCNEEQLCWNFEQGKIPDGFIVSRDDFGGELIVDNTNARSGSYALHAKALVGGEPNKDGGPKKSLRYKLPVNFGSIIWGRMYVYISTEAPNSHAGLFNARYVSANSSDTHFNALDWYEVASYQQRYMAIWHPPEPPGFPEWVQLSDKKVITNQWTCLEWKFDGDNGSKKQAADPQVWLNDTELRWSENFVFSIPAGAPRPTQNKAENFTDIEVGVVMYQGLKIETNWWIDDLVIAKARVGCD